MKLHFSKICFWDCKGTSQFLEWSDKILTINNCTELFLAASYSKGKKQSKQKDGPLSKKSWPNAVVS